MHTGVSNQESLSQVLRNISQRRRQGVLELRAGDRIIQIHFVQGKIVELIERGANPAQEIANAFMAAGFLDQSTYQQASTYRELVAPLRNGPAGSSAEELVKQAVRHRILSNLYSLDLEAPALNSFDSTMVEYQREFAPAISVGQVLLDLVALQSDRPKFLSVFAEPISISRGPGDSGGLSDEEAILYALLVEEQDLATLRRRSMLSEYAFQDALLRMHEQKCLVVQKSKLKVGSEDFLDEQMLNHLDAAIDEVFEEEGFTIPAQSLSDPESQIASSPAGELAIVREGDEAIQDVGGGAFLSRGIKRRLALASSRALHMHWVPAFVMVLFLLSTLLVPLYFWHRVFEAFAG